MRKKLVSLIREITPYWAESLADYLLIHGWTNPVRCKDCKHYDNGEGIQWCHLNSRFYLGGFDWHSFPEDGFCSYGERRIDG